MTFAMVFPGQGSQSVGMQAALASAYPRVKATYAEASEILGYDLWRLAQEGPQESLDDTVVTQPAMLAAGIAAWRCWLAAGGPRPSWLAGHSLGEYSALVAAEALSFADAIAVVRRRAELMQDAVPKDEGAMAAILGLDDDTVVSVCVDAENGEVVRAVNFNAPGQVVIAGHREAVARATKLAKKAGAKRAMLLRVSVPSHSPLMQPAADALAEHLDTISFNEPSIAVVNNVDVKTYADAADIRSGLQRQVCNPVHWTASMRRLADAGVDSVFECGPGKVLAGLLRRIDRGITCVAIEDPDTMQAALQACEAEQS